MEFCGVFLTAERRQVMELTELQLHKYHHPEIIKDEHVITFLKEKTK